MKYALVVDLGATNLRVALVNENYEILKKVKCSTSKSKDIAFTIFTEFKNMGIDCELSGIAVGVPGSIDFKNNIIRDLPNLNIKEYDLYSALYKLFNVPVKIVNDASLAALGEAFAYDCVESYTADRKEVPSVYCACIHVACLSGIDRLQCLVKQMTYS